MYVVAYAWWDARRETTNRILCRATARTHGLYGVACIVVGFGSGLMHASLMSFGHKMDVLGMFFAFVALMRCSGHAGFPSCPSRPPLAHVAHHQLPCDRGDRLLMVYRKEIAGDEQILGWLFLLIILV